MVEARRQQDETPHTKCPQPFLRTLLGSWHVGTERTPIQHGLAGLFPEEQDTIAAPSSEVSRSCASELDIWNW